MKLRVMLSLLAIPLAPAAGAAQQPLVRTPLPIGAELRREEHRRTASATLADSTRTRFNNNLFRGAGAGLVAGGAIGVFASEHQTAGPGFTHTPAVLFVAAYGGLGVLLGLIAGTMLPGS